MEDKELNDYNGAYRGMSYYAINESLSGKTPNFFKDKEKEKTFYQKIGEKINNNIENNPLQDSIEMYRGMSLDINTLASLKKGNIFEPKSILSMSTNEKIAKKYMNYAKERGKNNVLIKIKTKKGDKIAPIPYIKKDEGITYGEQEFVSSYKNKYRIKSVTTNKGKGQNAIYILDMEVL